MQKLTLKSRLITAMTALIVLASMPFAAMALSPETTEQVMLPLDSLPGWVGIVVAALYGLSHAVALLPETITNRLPEWVKWLLKYVAANYGKSKNKDS